MTESFDFEQAFEEAVAIHRTGNLPAAEETYRAILRELPTHRSALTNLGVILAQNGKLDEAIRCQNLALAADPGFPDAHYNLGNVYRRAGALDLALEAYRLCLQYAPNHENAAFNLGLTASALGLIAEAEAAYRRALEIAPRDLDAQSKLGQLLIHLERRAEGIAELRLVVEHHPTDPRGYTNLGLALISDQQPVEAIELLYKALKQWPKYAEAHNALGLALQQVEKYDDAMYHYQEAVTHKPELVEAWSNWAMNLADQGRMEEALEFLRVALEKQPNSPMVFSNRLALLHAHGKATPEQIRDEHFAWGQRFAPEVPPAPAPLLPHDPNRRLRIGYVSGNFRKHSSAGFVETLFRNHDRDKFEVFAYSNTAMADGVSQRMQGLVDHWRPIREVADFRVAQQIAEDRIDILVDLNGHLAGNRLFVFAYRPAAVQVSLFGYPDTTGLKSIDYRISDPVSDPPGVTDSLWSEELLRLPDVSWVYRPPEAAPPVNSLPAGSKRAFTFGCLNNPTKIGEQSIAAWAKLLQAAAGSRLVLMSGPSQQATKRLLEKFAKTGILRERITLVNRMTEAKYFEQYHEIDIALDPFPYNGGTTTADALWMGVPAISVAGRTYASRQGAMMLYTLGLSDFVAESAAAIPDLGKMWMSRRGELAEIRKGLRERFAASPLADGERYVRHLEASLREVWVKRLAD